MKSKNLQFVIFCAIFWITNPAVGQTAKCDYSVKGSYTCNLDTSQVNYGKKLTRIDGQHETGHSDADLKAIYNLLLHKLKKISPIFCQRFPNLERILIIFAALESIDEDSLSNCKSLNQLGLFGNIIQELPENLLTENSKLTELSISNNQLTTLPENLLLNQEELKSLLLSENQINFLPSNIFRPLFMLETLHLHENNLESINPEWFVNLQNLKGLGLHKNQISEIPSKCFASLRNLEKFKLNGNKIKTLHSDSFDGLKNLQTFDLSTNEISDLPVGVFTPLTSLKKLALDHNKLTTIHSDSFGVLNKLKEIYLQNNKINAIDPKFIDNTAISELDMRDNICSQIDAWKRSEIKPNLRKWCFKNYQPRLTEPNTCGKGLNAMSTITGGTTVERGMFPWMAALIKSNGEYFCGGTLISNRKVVTAAHCMEFLASDIKVLLGVFDLSKQHVAGRFSNSVQSINIHPDWNPETDTYDADIAVVVLETEVTFSSLIQPICLMDSNSTLAARTEGVVVGYGNDEDPKKLHLNIPKSIKMPIHKNEDCFLKNSILAKLSSNRTFCGGSGTGVGVCKSDSGSGLVVTDGSAFYLRGIVSASLRNMTYGCDVDTYSIFTNVLNFTDWISEVSVDPSF